MLNRVLAMGAGKSGDIVVAVFAAVIVIMMIVPMPTPFLDAFMSLNISLSLMILLSTFYINRPVEFSVFPTLILIMTLFRLALNVSSTRLILLEGMAFGGKIIRTFGSFVVRGNYIVGLIIFLIITVVQFVVITRGAERTAEVAARFTLDAMPGKQMSIDSELNAGLITEEEAKRRRREIQREADFYGAMDGAVRFIRGDAIAGLIITAINILGGLLIGVWQRGEPLEEALRTYVLLTIGDGLASQIPALLISTATGVVVSRAAVEEGFGKELLSQIAGEPKTLRAVGLLVLGMSLIPGFPKLALWALAALFLGLAWAMERKMKEEEKAAAEKPPAPEVVTPAALAERTKVDPVELEIGYALVPLADPSQGGDLLDRITMIRRQMASDLGLVLRPIRVRDNVQLKPTEYVIKIKGVEAARGEVFPDRFLAMKPGGEAPGKELEGIKTREPVFGLPAIWISEDQRERAEQLGYTVVDASSVIVTHLSEVIRENAAELLDRETVRLMVENLRQDYGATVEEATRKLTYGEIQTVLRNLLREQIPIRDLVTILEALSEVVDRTKHPVLMTEYVRQALSKLISRLVARDKTIDAVMLSQKVEEKLSGELVTTDTNVYLKSPPRFVEKLRDEISKECAKAISKGVSPVLVVMRPELRPAVRAIVPKELRVHVISSAEIDPTFEINMVGMVEVQE